MSEVIAKEGELRAVEAGVSELLCRASTFFKPGTKITFLARQPDNDDGDFILSTDDIDEVVRAFQRKHHEHEPV